MTETIDSARHMRKTWVRLYKNGDHMGVETNATEEDAFWAEFSSVLSMALEKHIGDMEFQLLYWLPQAFEIVAQLRGYKASVSVTQILTSGHVYGDKSQHIYEISAPASPLFV